MTLTYVQYLQPADWSFTFTANFSKNTLVHYQQLDSTTCLKIMKILSEDYEDFACMKIWHLFEDYEDCTKITSYNVMWAWLFKESCGSHIDILDVVGAPPSVF